jgi:hypothetical protein
MDEVVIMKNVVKKYVIEYESVESILNNETAYLYDYKIVKKNVFNDEYQNHHNGDWEDNWKECETGCEINVYDTYEQAAEKAYSILKYYKDKFKDDLKFVYERINQAKDKIKIS